MRRVELHLNGPEGWAGRRRVLVVREGQTEVLLLQFGTGKRLTLRRSQFERGNPITIPKDVPRVRAAVEELETRKTDRTLLRAVGRAILHYIKRNIVNQRPRMGWEFLDE